MMDFDSANQTGRQYMAAMIHLGFPERPDDDDTQGGFRTLHRMFMDWEWGQDRTLPDWRGEPGWYLARRRSIPARLRQV